MSVLAQTVGKNARNKRHDVLLVQMLLNQNMGFLMPRKRLSLTGVCDDNTVDAIRDYQVRVLRSTAPDGRVDPNGRTLRSLLGRAKSSIQLGNVVRDAQDIQSPKLDPIAPVDQIAPGGGPGQRYTKNENERVTTKTRPTYAQVRDMVKSTWSEVTEVGARTLTAQFAVETGGGAHCYNWNLGNLKGIAAKPHMYLRDVPEVMEAGLMQREIAKANAQGPNLARQATDEEAKKWKHTDTQMVGIFEPPSAMTRFRAFDSLAEGASGWLGKHKNIAAKSASYLGVVNAGKFGEMAKIMFGFHYFFSDPGSYAAAMAGVKKSIDTQLGPVT